MTANGKDTIRLTMAQALVKYLQLQFSEQDGQQQRLIPGIFGIFGHGNVAGLGQAIYEYGQDLPYYQPRNEQSMVHTAVGFAKAMKRRSTYACTSSIGPGATNMVTGAAVASVNRIPVLLLPSDYYATRHQGVVLQELEHPISADISVNDCLRPVSRFFDRLTRPEQLLTALPEAMRVLTDPAETGAVTLSLPQDIQAHAYDYPGHFFQRRAWKIERRQPDADRIREAVGLLKEAKRPMILAGGGVHYSEAQEELETFWETFGIPVGETFAGKSAIRNGSGLLLGGHGVTGAALSGNIASGADLVICVGTRMSDFATGSNTLFQNPDVKFIQINICGHDAYKMGALPVTADAREALRALTQAATSAGIQPNSDYLQEIGRVKQQWQKQLETEVYCSIQGQGMGQGELIGVLNAEAQSGDTIVAAAGTPPGDLLQLWDASAGRFCHLEFGFSCMGYELPAGLGVRLAQTEGEVFVFVGDGTYILQPTELITATQEQLKLTVVISQNHGFQSIHNLQNGRAGHSFGNEFRHRDNKTNRLEGEYVAIDFAKNAESMGAKTWNVSTPDQVQQALRAARKESGTCVIVADVEPRRYCPSSEVWWDVAAAEASNDPLTQKLRAEYVEQRDQLQRLYY
jgi:3D-(3,5/4)-trihydroxycyclohexane-1,2-dione acylhydrolase (decyclizing)